MIAGCRRYIYCFSVQSSHKACVLPFGINDDNIIIGSEENIEHFTLSCEALAAARRAKNKAIRVFEIQPVEKNHVIGKSVQSVVHTVLLVDLL